MLVIIVSFFILSFIIIPLADKSSHWYIVTSGSMEPTLKVGDIVFVSDANADEIKVGDIISFYNEEREYTITHRCIEILQQGNETFFKTKGDANEDNDTFLTPEDALVGKIPYMNLFGHKIYAKIPRLGYLSHFTHTKIGFFLLILLPGYALIGMEAYNIFTNLQERHRKKERTNETKRRHSPPTVKESKQLLRGYKNIFSNIKILPLFKKFKEGHLEMATCPKCNGIFYYEKLNGINEVECVFCGKKWRIKC